MSTHKMKRTSINAIVALVLAVLAYIAGLSLLGAIPAIYLANRALEEIHDNPDLEGKDLAQVALVLGWLNVVGSLLIMVFLCYILLSQ